MGSATATVGFENITASTALPVEAPFSVDMIADGITGGALMNGLVTNGVGTVTLKFNQDYHLSSLLLWNDVIVIQEGIDQFSLRFYDSGDNQIATSFQADYIGPLGQESAQEYVFQSPVWGVRRVDLEVFTSQSPVWTNRIEIREVDFGVVPEPGALALLGLAGGGIAFRRSRR